MQQEPVTTDILAHENKMQAPTVIQCECLVLLLPLWYTNNISMQSQMVCHITLAKLRNNPVGILKIVPYKM